MLLIYVLSFLFPMVEISTLMNMASVDWADGGYQVGKVGPKYLRGCALSYRHSQVLRSAEGARCHPW